MKKLWMNHHCRERRGPNQRNKRLHTKRTTLHFVVGNEQRFPLLLGTNNTLRIFMVLSETKSALVIKISQIIALFTVWYSDLLSILFFGRLDFFSGDITIISYGQVAISPKVMSPETWVMLPEKKNNVREIVRIWELYFRCRLLGPWVHLGHFYRRGSIINTISISNEIVRHFHEAKDTTIITTYSETKDCKIRK